MKEPVYEVFARKTREEPLRHIGYLNALDDDLARVYAWKTYDEQNWFEMCVVPRAAILAVNRPQSAYAASDRDLTGAMVHAAGAGSYGGSEIAGQDTASK